jgi:hypothetical protein
MPYITPVKSTSGIPPEQEKVVDLMSSEGKYTHLDKVLLEILPQTADFDKYHHMSDDDTYGLVAFPRPYKIPCIAQYSWDKYFLLATD